MNERETEMKLMACRADLQSKADALAQVSVRLGKLEAAARGVVDEDAASVSGERSLRDSIADLAEALK